MVVVAIDDPILVVEEVGLVLQLKVSQAQVEPLLAVEDEVIAVGSLADDPTESKSREGNRKSRESREA